MSDEAALADLLELVLSGRAERLVDFTAAAMPPDERAALRLATEAVAVVGGAEPRVEPSAGLRDRVLASLARVAQRRARAPRKALVVCDMINDHLIAGRPLEVPRARSIVAALSARIRAARASGTPVVYVVDRHAPDDADLDNWGAHAVEGTEGAEISGELSPVPGDRVVAKPSYSGFHATDLERVLDELAIDTLVLTGCATEVQLMATATDALERGFAIELPRDCQAGLSETGEETTLGVLAVLAPYGPARRTRLAKAQAAAEAARASASAPATP